MGPSEGKSDGGKLEPNDIDPDAAVDGILVTNPANEYCVDGGQNENPEYESRLKTDVVVTKVVLTAPGSEDGKTEKQIPQRFDIFVNLIRSGRGLAVRETHHAM